MMGIAFYPSVQLKKIMSFPIKIQALNSIYIIQNSKKNYRPLIISIKTKTLFVLIA